MKATTLGKLSRYHDKFTLKFNEKQVQFFFQYRLEFIRIKSYVNDSSTGEVNIIGMDNIAEAINGKNLLIVEDIIDTGKTMKKLLKTLERHNPKSVTVCDFTFFSPRCKCNLFSEV